jgi:hypothetical protein
MTETKRQNLKICFLATAVFSLVANAFAYFNLTPHHDSILRVLRFAGEWENSLGRFLLPVWGKLISDITIPWFTGLLSILFLSLTVWFCTEILNIRSKAGIILTSGFLSVNYSITELCGTFGYVLGAYTFALMLMCAGVWVVASCRSRASVIIAALFICISMGLYQAYITVGFSLFLILVMQQTASEERLRSHLREWIQYVASFVIGGILYFVIYKTVLHFTGIEAPDSYNSVSLLSNMGIRYLADGAIMIYKYFIRIWFLSEAPSTWLIAVINILLFLTTVFIVISRIMKSEGAKVGRTLLFFLCVALFPLASMLMQLLMPHDFFPNLDFLTSYAIFLIYPGCISLIEMNRPFSFSVNASESKRFVGKHSAQALCLVCALILFSFVRFSNEAYSVSKVIYDRAITAATMIMVEMDATEDYFPGETEVVVIGRLDSDESCITSLYDFKRFKSIRGYTKVAITYPLSFERYFRLMGHPINMNHKESIITLYENNPEVKEMPCYPAAGYCRMVDGRMVIKLAEEK